MRVLIVPSTFDFQNLGEIAMLQVAVKRMHRLFEGASIEVLSSAPALVKQFCPQASPVPYDGWLSEHYFLGAAHRALPSFASAELVSLKRWIRRTMPRVEAAAIRSKYRLQARDASAFDAWTRAFERADVMAVSGLGGIGDVFPTQSALYLDIIERGLGLGIPVAVFGHGFCPMQEPRLKARARRLLPRVSLIACREGILGPGILESLGVPADSVVVTGDDAVEIAYDARHAKLGRGLGINIRISETSGVLIADLERVRPVVQAIARKLSVPLVPVPIARQRQLDAEAIRWMMQGLDDASDGGSALVSATELLEQMHGCRVVLTGAYHAAVFALAQGIPTVCLVNSEYFATKFAGLADLFGPGCKLVPVNAPDVGEILGSTIEDMYASAEKLRPELLRKAEAQIERGLGAYGRFHRMVLHPEAAPRSTGVMRSPGLVERA